MSESLPETRYLLRRGLLSRGLTFSEEGPYTFRVETSQGVRFGISLMPGNRRIAIFHGSVVPEQLRGKGLGQKFLALREELAHEAGINLLLATVRDTNEPEAHILTKAGWVRLIERETGTTLWGKRI